MFKFFKQDANKENKNTDEYKDIKLQIEKSLEMSSRTQFRINVAETIYDNYDLFVLYLKFVNEALYRLKYKPDLKEVYVAKTKCELGEIEDLIKDLFGDYCINNFMQFFLEINYKIEKMNSSKHILDKIFNKTVVNELIGSKIDAERMKIFVENIEEANFTEFDSYDKWYEDEDEEKIKNKEMLVKIYEIDKTKSVESVLNTILYKARYGGKCEFSLREYIGYPYDKYNSFANIRYWILQLYLASMLASLIYLLKNTKKLIRNKELHKILTNLLAEAHSKNINFSEDGDIMDKFYLIYKQFYQNTFDKKLNRQELYIIASSVDFINAREYIKDFNKYDEEIEAFLNEENPSFDEFIEKLDCEQFIKYKAVNIGDSLCKDIHENRAVFEEIFDYVYLRCFKAIPNDERILILLNRHIYIDKLMHGYLFKNILLEKERLLNLN